jgi:hypothetical protein
MLENSVRPDIDLAASPLTLSGGWSLIAAGITGAMSALFLAVVPPAVAETQFSYPLDLPAYAAVQSFFFVHHLTLAFGVFAVWRSGLAGVGRLAAVGGVASTIALLLLAIQELVVIGAGSAAYPSPEADTVGATYGVLSLLCGATLVVFGIAAIRARRWTGWRRAIILILGVYVFVPLTPAIMGPFVLARLTIGIWTLLFAALGWALLHPAPRAAAEPPPGVQP